MRAKTSVTFQIKLNLIPLDIPSVQSRCRGSHYPPLPHGQPLVLGEFLVVPPIHISPSALNTILPY